MRIKIVYYAGWLVTRLITKLIFRIRVRGQEHIPRHGGFILASNHISNYDAPILGSWSTREVYFFAKKELFKNTLFAALIRRANAFPVKRGTIDREALGTSRELISAGFGLVFFPEGTRSLKDGFLDPKPGVGLLATDAACPVVPCYLHGSNKLKDVFWGRDRMSIRFGEPLSPGWMASIPKDKEGYQKIAAEIMDRITRLKLLDYPARRRSSKD